MGSYDRLAFVNFANDVDAVAAFDANVVVVFHDMQASIKPLSSGRDYSNIFVEFSLLTATCLKYSCLTNRSFS